MTSQYINSKYIHYLCFGRKDHSIYYRYMTWRKTLPFYALKEDVLIILA